MSQQLSHVIRKLAFLQHELSVSKFSDELLPYIFKVVPIIEKLLSAPKTPYKHLYTHFGDNTDEFIELACHGHYVRQIQMKEGSIAQICIGNFDGFEDLGIGHYTGLDVRKTDNSMVIELKNRHNTCNSSSQKVLLDKLNKYSELNPETQCIWGIVNSNKVNQERQNIYHKKSKILKLQDKSLLDYIFTKHGKNYTDQIIRMVQICRQLTTVHSVTC